MEAAMGARLLGEVEETSLEEVSDAIPRWPQAAISFVQADVGLQISDVNSNDVPHSSILRPGGNSIFKRCAAHLKPDTIPEWSICFDCVLWTTEYLDEERFKQVLRLRHPGSTVLMSVSRIDGDGARETFEILVPVP